MSNRERADRFAQYVGMELKGSIVARGWTAQKIAESTGRSASALNRWLNGKQELPLAVLCEAAELIDVEPSDIVDAAYSRMAVALGERGGRTYPEDDRRVAEKDWPAEDASS